MSDISSLQRQPSLLSLPQTDALLGSKPGSDGLQRPPLQRGIASRHLTPPPRPQESSSVPRGELTSSASEKAKGGWKKATPSSKERGEHVIGKAREKADEAKKMGVDAAKHSFWKKLASIAVAAVGVAIFGGLTAVSFGAATPLLAIAGAALAVSIGDAVCAYRNYKNVEAEANHKPLPYAELPMGNSFLGNVGFKLAKAVGASEESAQTFGKMGAIVGGGLAVAAIALSGGLGSLPMLASIMDKSSEGLNGAPMNSPTTKEEDREKHKKVEDASRELAKQIGGDNPDVDGSGTIDDADGGSDVYRRAQQRADRREDEGWHLGPFGGSAMDKLLGRV